jgi:hypothetical protein
LYGIDSDHEVISRMNRIAEDLNAIRALQLGMGNQYGT